MTYFGTTWKFSVPVVFSWLSLVAVFIWDESEGFVFFFFCLLAVFFGFTFFGFSRFGFTFGFFFFLFLSYFIGATFFTFVEMVFKFVEFFIFASPLYKMRLNKFL